MRKTLKTNNRQKKNPDRWIYKKTLETNDREREKLSKWIDEKPLNQVEV